MAYIVEVQYYNSNIFKDSGNTFHIEEARIRGSYNGKSMDYGVRAHLTNPDYTQETRENTLIYSGIYNSRTGVNNTNQFPSGANITKSLDINGGSIQKLFAEDTNLTVFQEEKVSWIAVDKDILYTAEGTPQVTQASQVLGQVVPYAGNYGIGIHPESFAYYAGRKYFVDQPKGLVLRLSRDGITEISDYGMRSYFRTNLGNIDNSTDSIVGCWDIHNKNYVVSLQYPSNYTTLAFSEEGKGWTSFFDYKPLGGGSIDGKFYTFNGGDLWEHYSGSYNSFHGAGAVASEVELIFNQNPSANKNFLTVNYEGTAAWSISNITSDVDSGENIAVYSTANDDLIISGFKKYDNKYFANIINSATSVNDNEVVLGSNMSGIKGHYTSMKIKTTDTAYQELFAVSTNYNINSY